MSDIHIIMAIAGFGFYCFGNMLIDLKKDQIGFATFSSCLSTICFMVSLGEFLTFLKGVCE